MYWITVNSATVMLHANLNIDIHGSLGCIDIINLLNYHTLGFFKPSSSSSKNNLNKSTLVSIIFTMKYMKTIIVKHLVLGKGDIFSVCY